MTTTHDPVREALRAKLERAKAAFNSDEFASDSIRLSFSEIEQLLATPARPQAGEAVSVAYRAWFDEDNGARWLFTLWPDEDGGENLNWQPLYAHPTEAAPAIPEGETLADRLDWLADRQTPGSQTQSDLFAAATIWRKYLKPSLLTEAAPATAVDPAREALTAEQEIAIREGLEAAAILIWGPHFAYSSDDERVFSQGFRSGWGAREHPRTVARLPLSTTKD